MTRIRSARRRAMRSHVQKPLFGDLFIGRSIDRVANMFGLSGSA